MNPDDIARWVLREHPDDISERLLRKHAERSYDDAQRMAPGAWKQHRLPHIVAPDRDGVYVITTLPPT